MNWPWLKLFSQVSGYSRRLTLKPPPGHWRGIHDSILISVNGQIPEGSASLWLTVF